MNYDDSLAIAKQIGKRLVRQALWEGSACTWEIRVSDRSDPSSSALQRAGGPLYQGTAGIAWFLAELSRVAADTELARAAEGGLQYALEAGATMAPASFGFHSGRVGIAWVAARMAQILSKPEFLEDAWGLLEPLQGKEQRDEGLDVIDGAAGAIPALLELTTMLDREEPLEVARRLGNNLIRQAHREPDGWSWAMMSSTVVRHLNGLAHGASGVGLALLELACATGEARFRFGAEMAFLYERRFFDPTVSNWPDLRNTELSNFTFYEGRQDELLTRAREGTLPQYELHFMAGWCHGSPGIGLSRLRAFELTGQEIYRREALAALRSTLDSCADISFERTNFSLCHGLGGNCDLPLIAATQLGEPAWRERVVKVAHHGWETYERPERPWPCGTVNQVTDPSLMLGEAGIGLFYLRLAKPDIPTPLLLRPRHEAADQMLLESSAGEFSALARDSADEFFSASRRSFERLTGSRLGWTPASSNGRPIVEAPAATLFSALHRCIDAAGGELRVLLTDAFREDRARWEATLAIDDFSAEFVRELTHSHWGDLDTRCVQFSRAPDSRLFALQRDWQGWLGEEGGESVSPEEEEVHVVLWRKHNRIYCGRVAVFSALLLDTLEEPCTLATLADRVGTSLDSPVDREILADRVESQLEELYRAGFVVTAESVSAQPGRDTHAP